MKNDCKQLLLSRQYVGTWFVNRESFEILEVGSRCGQESYAVINRNNTYEATYNATKMYSYFS